MTDKLKQFIDRISVAAPILLPLAILGLTYFILSNAVRTIAGASILALISGGYLVYSGVSGRELKWPLRIFVLILGLPLILAAFFGLRWVADQIITPPEDPATARIAEVREAEEVSLDLSDLGLTAVPPEVFELTQLRDLDLSDNRLTELPAGIGALHRLHHLQLDYNQLETLPSQIGALDELVWLHLYDNELTELPPEIGQLSGLEHLDLANNELTALPPEIGQLTRLENLYLTGNSIETLPPELDRLVESTGLNVVDHSDTQPGPIRSFLNKLLFPALFGGLLLLTTVINQWLTRREAAFRAANAQTGEVYAIPPFGQWYEVFVIVGTLFVDVFFLLSAANGARTDVSWGSAIGLTLVLAPPLLTMLCFLLHNYGTVVVTEDGITLHRLVRTKRLPYDEIVDVRESGLGIPPNLVLRGKGTTLRINRRVDNLPRIYDAVVRRMADQQVSDALELPHHLEVSQRSTAIGVGAAILLTLFCLGIGLGITLFMQGQPWISKDDLPLYTTVVWLASGFLCLVVLALFAIGWVKPQQASEIVLTEEAIRFRHPLRSWHTWEAGDLVAVEIEPETRFLYIKPRSFSASYEPWTTYHLILTFSEDRRIHIRPDRAWQFGATPERLARIFREVYEVRERVAPGSS